MHHITAGRHSCCCVIKDHSLVVLLKNFNNLKRRGAAPCTQEDDVMIDIHICNDNVSSVQGEYPTACSVFGAVNVRVLHVGELTL